MRALVTGGAGFIGSHLVKRLLSTRTAVTVMDDFNADYDPALRKANVAEFEGQAAVCCGDIRDRAFVEHAFEAGRFDIVFHLAARTGVRPSINDPEPYLTTNIDGTLHLLEAARRTGVRQFIFASSSSIYGTNPKVPFNESDPVLNTISPYAMTKSAGEQLCSLHANLHGLRTVCLRLFTVYGPRQRPDLAISTFTRLMREGKPLPRFGDGTTARDYTCVDDIVDGIVAAARYTGSPFEVFNLGASRPATLHELIATLETALGMKAGIETLPPQPGDVPLTHADIGKAARFLDYAPQVTLQEGIFRYVAWHRGHFGAP